MSRPVPDQCRRMTAPQARTADRDGHALLTTMAPQLSLLLFEAASTLGDAVFVTDGQGLITWANTVFADAVGRRTDEVVGCRRTDLARLPSCPQSVRLADELVAMRPVRVEFPTRDGAGLSRWISLSAVPVLDGDGHPIGMIGVERDVTEEHEAEHRRQQALRRAESLTVALEHEKRLLSQVIGTIPHVVWWKGSDLRYTGCNEAYLRLRGVPDKLDLIGRLEEQVAAPDGIGEQIAHLERSVLAAGRPVTDVKVGVGEQRVYQFSVVPFLDAGVIAGVIGVGADISHATELERQLAQANRLEAIGQLAAGIAHEINTPVQYASDNTRFVADAVSGVLGGLRELETLLDDPMGDAAGRLEGDAAGRLEGDAAGRLEGDAAGHPFDGAPSAADRAVRERMRGVLEGLDLDFVAEEVPSALAQSLEGLDRVSQIVRAMKDFSHPGQGRSKADLNRLITSTVQVSRNEWKYVAGLELALDPTLPPVPCFEGDLKQALLNIVVNAAHAIDERRRREGSDALGHIVVSSRWAGAGEVAIDVQDDGTGMDERTRERVFDPFFTTKEVGRGTGQGLTLARCAVKKHGGRIEVSSVPGEGSTFTLVLPMAEVAAADGSGEDEAVGAAPATRERRALE